MKKKNTTNIVTLSVLLLVIGFLFYWYELRSTQIRKICYLDTENKIDLLLKEKIINKTNSLSDEQKNILIDKYGNFEEGKDKLIDMIFEKINTSVKNDYEISKILQNESAYYYNNCLREKGLNK